MTSISLNTGMIKAKPYSAQEFAKVKSKPFGGSYTRYLSWWNQHVAPQAAAKAGLAGASVDTSGAQIPGALMTPAQLSTLGARTFPLMTPAAMLAQARGAVSQSMDPVIKQITGAIQTQTEGGRQAIEQLTEKFAQRVGNMDHQISSVYDTARAQEAGIGDALARYMSGQGATLAQGLQNAPFDLAAMGRNAGGAMMATGNAALSNLISQGAAATTEAKKLPGYARSFGLQNAVGFERQQGNKLQEALAQLAASGQGQEMDLYGALLAQNQASREGRANIMNQGLTRAATLAATQIGANVDLAGQAQQGQQFWAGLANGSNTTGAPSAKDIANYKATAFQNLLNNVFPVNPAAVGIGGQTVTPQAQLYARIPKAQRGDPWGFYYPQAVNYLTGVLSGTGVGQQAIDQLARKALLRFGITPTTFTRTGKAAPPTQDAYRHRG